MTAPEVGMEGEPGDTFVLEIDPDKWDWAEKVKAICTCIRKWNGIAE